MRLVNKTNGTVPLDASVAKELTIQSSKFMISDGAHSIRFMANFILKLSALVFICCVAPISVFAQSTGSRPADQIQHAKDIVEYDKSHGVCSSTYIHESSLLSACSSTVLAMSNLINAWQNYYDTGTLTVAYNTSVENELFNYETSLQNTLVAAGYSYSATSQTTREQAQAYKLATDQSLSDDAYCLVCKTAALGGYAVCLTTIEAPPAAMICVVVVALNYLNCAWDRCLPTLPKQPDICPPAPPKK